MEWLKGKKTYIVAVAAGIATIAAALGYIDNSVYTTIMGLLGAGGLATMRAGVEKNK